MAPSKKTSRPNRPGVRETVKPVESSDNLCPVWSFERADRDGAFAFNTSDGRVNAALVLQKLVDLSSMTWQQIKQQTHDKGRSKNHFITDVENWSLEAKNRFEVKCSQEESDSVFSFALNNLCRLIGIRDGRIFYIIWYDPKHKFYPVAR